MKKQQQQPEEFEQCQNGGKKAGVWIKIKLVHCRQKMIKVPTFTTFFIFFFFFGLIYYLSIIYFFICCSITFYFFVIFTVKHKSFSVRFELVFIFYFFFISYFSIEAASMEPLLLKNLMLQWIEDVIIWFAVISHKHKTNIAFNIWIWI